MLRNGIKSVRLGEGTSYTFVRRISCNKDKVRGNGVNVHLELREINFPAF